MPNSFENQVLSNTYVMGYGDDKPADVPVERSGYLARHEPDTGLTTPIVGVSHIYPLAGAEALNAAFRVRKDASNYIWQLDHTNSKIIPPQPMIDPSSFQWYRRMRGGTWYKIRFHATGRSFWTTLPVSFFNAASLVKREVWPDRD